jgi:putative holliday junction resolvase
VSLPSCVSSETGRLEPDPVRQGVRLAVDVGSVRIGVAGSDPAGLLASPVRTVRRGRGDLAEIARLAADRQAIEIVVGLPTGLSGKAGQAAGQARDFAAALAEVVAPLPVRLIDERFTTVIAHAALRQGGRTSKERRTVIDQAAAALLLQGALDTERRTGRPSGEVVSPIRAVTDEP